MALTLFELKGFLCDVDEVTLLEKLEITSEDLVERFVDKIEDNYDDLAEEFSPEASEDEE